MPSSALWAVDLFGRVFTLSTAGHQWEPCRDAQLEFKRVSAARDCCWGIACDHQVYVLVGASDVPIRCQEEAYENQVGPRGGRVAGRRPCTPDAWPVPACCLHSAEIRPCSRCSLQPCPVLTRPLAGSAQALGRVPGARDGCAPSRPGLRPVSASGLQRWNPMGGFCEALLPSDRWPWSDVSGLQHRPLDGVALPSPHWSWESDWYVDENFGGEPTEKGVGELGPRRWGCPIPSVLPRPLSAAPSAPWRRTSAWAPRAPCLLDGAHRVTLQATSCLPAPLPSRSPFPGSFLSFPGKLPEAPHPHLDVSGVDVCHRLPCHLHKGQEVEFLCAAPEVDPVQEIQVSGYLGQGLGTCRTRGHVDSRPEAGRAAWPSGSWPLTPSSAECCDPVSLPLGDGHSGSWAGLWPRAAQQGVALVSGLPCPGLRLDLGTSSSPAPHPTPPHVGATQALVFFQ